WVPKRAGAWGVLSALLPRGRRRYPKERAVISRLSLSGVRGVAQARTECLPGSLLGFILKRLCESRLDYQRCLSRSKQYLQYLEYCHARRSYPLTASEGSVPVDKHVSIVYTDT